MRALINMKQKLVPVSCPLNDHSTAIAWVPILEYTEIERAKNRQSIQSCFDLVWSGPFPFALHFLTLHFLACSCVEFG